jgi:hypothetical protein
MMKKRAPVAAMRAFDLSAIVTQDGSLSRE